MRNQETEEPMQYVQLGDSGLTVSRLALGTMTFGQYSFSTFHANVDQPTADRMVGLALDAGVRANASDARSITRATTCLGARARARSGRI
jgi:hypothetical protein